jgi:hypothetical protein
LIWSLLIGLFRSRAALQAENLVLRQQILVLRRKAPKRLSFSAPDRLILIGVYRLFPDVRSALAVVRPETVLRWHRAGFRAYWRWKSRSRTGRPKVLFEFRQLIREMSLANPLWGAPRIHGELLKLGIDIGQTTVAKYMARRRRPPSQGWRTFLRNHADGIAAMDLFVVPTISFRLLYGLLILRHDRSESDDARARSKHRGNPKAANPATYHARPVAAARDNFTPPSMGLYSYTRRGESSVINAAATRRVRGPSRCVTHHGVA